MCEVQKRVEKESATIITNLPKASFKMHFNELPLAKHKISRPLKNCPLSIPISGTTFWSEKYQQKTPHC